MDSGGLLAAVIGSLRSPWPPRPNSTPKSAPNSTPPRPAPQQPSWRSVARVFLRHQLLQIRQPAHRGIRIAKPLFAARIDVAEMSLAKTKREWAQSYISLGARPDVTDAF